jgi:hypothetical protein
MLLFSNVHAEDSSSCVGIIQYETTISASAIRINFEGEPEYIFTLSDTTRWMTNGNETFTIATGWNIGDHLTIVYQENGWIAANVTQKTSVPLVPLCHKSVENL